jgi:hypothetical protein
MDKWMDEGRDEKKERIFFELFPENPKNGFYTHTKYIQTYIPTYTRVRDD